MEGNVRENYRTAFYLQKDRDAYTQNVPERTADHIYFNLENEWSYLNLKQNLCVGNQS